MKKIIIALLTVAMILSVATVFASAAQTEEQLAYVGKIQYGNAIIDGEKDTTYPADPTIDSFVYNGDAYEEGKETYFNAYLLWDDYNFYGFIEVRDLTPVTYATESWKTDCIQLYFIFQDWDTTIGSGDNIVGDANTMTSVMFRCINPSSKESATLTDATFSGLSTLWFMISSGGKSQLVAKKTDTGYVYEFVINMPDQIAPEVNRAGHAIGFGIQCNDDRNDDNARDNIVYSSNLDSSNHGKTGKFILLNENGQVPGVEQDYMGTTGADYVTQAPENNDETKVTTEEETNPPKTPETTTTKVPTTTAKPEDTTTKAPTATTTAAPAESGCGGFVGVWTALIVSVGAAVTVVIKKK